MSTETPPPLVVDIKLALEMDHSDHSPSSLNYGTPSTGKMATTSKIITPLALFHQSPIQVDSQNDSTSVSDEEDEQDDLGIQRIGISRPSYYSNEDERAIVPRSKKDAHRIGISPASYEKPEGDLPFSPHTLMKRIDRWNFSPTSVLEDYGNDDEYANSWWPQIGSPPPVPHSPVTQSDALVPHDGVRRMVHPQTASGHFLVNSAPLTPSPSTTENNQIRYNLANGKKTKVKRDRSERMLIRKDSSLSDSSFRSNRRLSLNDSMSQCSVASVLGCSNPFKIFVLLLQPRAKIFELIQLIYSPSVTTVGDILDMIPSNATEPALGNQDYYGLCRPKDGHDITDTELMASAPGGEGCARITQGEILLAIPETYSGYQIAKFGKPLLKNPKIIELMKRNDPLSAKQRRKSETNLALKNTPHNIPEEETLEFSESVDDRVRGSNDVEQKTNSYADRSNSTRENADSSFSSSSSEGYTSDELHAELTRLAEKKQQEKMMEKRQSIRGNKKGLGFDARLELLKRKSLKELDTID